MGNEIEITVGDVNDVEARVYARYCGAAAEDVSLRGTLRGPFCDAARTLPAEFVFRPAADESLAEAVIPDPCTWSLELPHLYQANVEAWRGKNKLAEYRGLIGLRRVETR